MGCWVWAPMLYIQCLCEIKGAEVAELVDALGSGSSVLTDVGVRVPSTAPINTYFSSVIRWYYSFQ